MSPPRAPRSNLHSGNDSTTDSSWRQHLLTSSTALQLQRDLAHHHGLWHRIPISDLLIAETALFHNFGKLHVDGEFERIAQVRPLVLRRVG